MVDEDNIDENLFLFNTMENLEQELSIDMVEWLDQMPLTATMEVLNQLKK